MYTPLFEENKSIILFDLDETLINCKIVKKSEWSLIKQKIDLTDIYDVQLENSILLFKIRPLVKDLILKAKQFGTIGIWTNASRPYAEYILKIITGKFNVHFNPIICINEIPGAHNKELISFQNIYKYKRYYIIDDLERNILANKNFTNGKAIPISPYYWEYTYINPTNKQLHYNKEAKEIEQEHYNYTKRFISKLSFYIN